VYSHNQIWGIYDLIWVAMSRPKESVNKKTIEKIKLKFLELKNDNQPSNRTIKGNRNKPQTD
jgi:hypothetical protein